VSGNDADRRSPVNAVGSFARKLWLAVAVCVLAITCVAQQTDISELSLEDLMNIEVTTVGKREQRLSQIPAAVYVITQDEIRRSGATNIPDALRLVPGIEVAQIDNTNWAISIRGANSISSNKLLVLIDGRSVYYPTYSNVFWDVQDTVLEDIDRIEVIRGPGASLWGANAVNGVINIVTKRAEDTQGALVSAGGGNYDHAFGAVRYGGAIGNAGHYRAFSKFSLRDNLVPLPASLLDGQSRMLRGGFRADLNLSAENSLTLQGDIYQGVSPQAVYGSVLTRSPLVTKDDLSVDGGNVLLRWKRRLRGGSDTAIQVYYDRSRHPDILLTQFHEVLDFDFQHHLRFERQDILWGGGFRNTRQASQGTWELSLNPSGRRLSLFGGFFQDEIALVRNRLTLTTGVKVERNDYSGVEVQPTLRLLWTPTQRQSVWASVSRAVRLPCVWDKAIVMTIPDYPLPDGTQTFATLSKNASLRSEELLAYELGYRAQPAKRLSLDVAGFFQRYNHLTTLLQNEPFFSITPSPPHVTIPHVLSNLRNGNTYGVEISSNYTPLDWWKISGSYSYLRQITHNIAPGKIVYSFPNQDGDDPRNQFQLHSYLTLPHSLEVDTGLYYVGALVGQGVQSYRRLDARLGWRPNHSLELSVGAQNLLEASHYEFKPYWEYLASGKIERSFYGRLTWHF
jgi:iron complex outermembrane recepter protein